MRSRITSTSSIIVIAAVIVAIVAGWFAFKPADLVLEGQVEVTQVRVASKLTGRVLSLFVKRGQSVSKGEALVLINSPELEAKYEQALAAQKAATAQRRKAMSGAREEEVRSVREMWLKAKTGTDLAQKTYDRAARLYKEGVIPQQKFDEAEAQLTAAKRTEDAARAGLDMANSGARVEDKESAQALLDQASGMVSEVRAYLQETRLVAPISGEVVDVLAEQGELVAQGYPMIMIADLNDIWITFNVREDLLPGIAVGDQIGVIFPALGDKVVRFRINYIAAMGDFATWRATKASGDFDLKTFEVRAQPVDKIENLRPGMTALINWKDAVAENKSRHTEKKSK